MNTISPKTPSNIPGRAPVHLSEEADDEIRYHFHLLLAEKILSYDRYSSRTSSRCPYRFSGSLTDNSSKTHAPIRFFIQKNKQCEGGIR